MSHKAEDRFKGLLEASVSTALSNVAFIVIFCDVYTVFCVGVFLQINGRFKD